MDDYVLYISGGKFPPDAQSSLTGKRKTARICHVEQEDEESYQVSWSLRAAPTVQFIPRRMLSYAIKSMLETAVDACPVQIFFILEDLYSDNWFIELVAYLVQATSVEFLRPVVIHLVQGESIQDNIDTSELEAMLNSADKLSLSSAVPAPWCWYGDLSIPGYETSLFPIVLQSEDPVITDIYSSSKKRNQIKFIDILNGGEMSDLTLDQLQDKPMNVLIPGGVMHCLRKILNGGFMLVRLPGNFSSSNYALYETNQRQWVMRKISIPAKREPIKDSDLMESDYSLPNITAGDLCESMFSDSNFDFSTLKRQSHQVTHTPYYQYSPVDVNRALNLLKVPTPVKKTEGTPKRSRIGSDVSFFSPHRIISNQLKIVENIEEAKHVRNGKPRRGHRQRDSSVLSSPVKTETARPLCTINSPRAAKLRTLGYIKESSPIKRIMNRNYEKQAELFNERLNETASLASRKPQKKQKLTRLNSLTGRARGSLSSRKSVSGITETKTQSKRSSTGEVLRQTKLTDRRHSIAVHKLEMTTKSSNERSKTNLYNRSMSNISQQSNLSITSNKSVTSTNSNYSVFSAARSERSETQSERLSDLMDTSDGSRCTQETQGPPRTPAQKDEDDPKRKLSGSEKKARLLKIVRAELEKLGMNTRHQNYKKCIKKLHEMCRMMLKGVTTADKLVPLMAQAAKANAPLVIASINSES